MGSDLGAALLGLASAVSWGSGDFCGGLAARRMAVPWVLMISASAGLLLLLGLAFGLGEPVPPLASMGWGLAAGVFGTLGLAMLYHGLAVGRAALIAPTSAVIAAVLPATWGALSAGLPPWQRLLGFALALLGIWLVAQGAGGSSGALAGLGSALLAGLGFGAFFVLIDRAGDGGTYWPLVAARSVTLLLMAATLVARRTPAAWSPSNLGIGVLTGVLDVGGNSLFVLANQLGRLDVIAVLASLYPASTVVLAALLLREPITRPQLVGLVVILLAIVLIVV